MPIKTLNITIALQEIVSNLNCKENTAHYCPNCDRSLFDTLQLAQKVLIFLEEKNKGLLNSQLFIVAENAIEEIDILIDGRVDITDAGGPNYAMKIQQELLYIKFVIAKLKQQEQEKYESTRIK